jgi:hypothetical protein
MIASRIREPARKLEAICIDVSAGGSLMSAAGQRLFALAAEAFPDLTDAEETLCRRVAAGKIADYPGPTLAQNDPQQVRDWGCERTIRAKVIRWLCVDREAITHVDPNGIRIDAAKIIDALHLEAVTIPFPLVFIRCAIADGVYLTHADTRLVSFEGSAIGQLGGIALQADGIKMNGSLVLRQGFRAKGTVSLISATITGDLIFRQAQAADMHFSLAGAKIERLVDDKDSWCNIQAYELDGFVYTTIANSPADPQTRLAWLERQSHQSFRPQPYQQLAKVLRERGQEGDAKRVLIAKERARRKRGHLGWAAWCWNGFLGLTMAHGYRPQQLLIGAAVFVLLGRWFFGAGYQAGLMVPTQKEPYAAYAQTREVPAYYPAFHPWMYALDTLVPIINFGQKEYWRPQNAIESSGHGGGGAVQRRRGPDRPPHAIQRAVYDRPQDSDLVAAVDLPPRPSSLIAWFKAPPWVTTSTFLRGYRWFHVGVGWVLITLGITGVTGLVRKE